MTEPTDKKQAMAKIFDELVEAAKASPIFCLLLDWDCPELNDFPVSQTTKDFFAEQLQLQREREAAKGEPQDE